MPMSSHCTTRSMLWAPCALRSVRWTIAVHIASCLRLVQEHLRTISLSSSLPSTPPLVPVKLLSSPTWRHITTTTSYFFSTTPTSTQLLFALHACARSWPPIWPSSPTLFMVPVLGIVHSWISSRLFTQPSRAIARPISWAELSKQLVACRVLDSFKVRLSRRLQ